MELYLIILTSDTLKFITVLTSPHIYSTMDRETHHHDRQEDYEQNIRNARRGNDLRNLFGGPADSRESHAHLECKDKQEPGDVSLDIKPSLRRWIGAW